MQPTRPTHAALAVVFAALAAAGCARDPGKDQPQAQTAAPAASTAAAAGKTYVIAPGDSRVEFTGAKVTASHDGAFQRFSGSVVIPDGKIEQGRVTVEIDMASLAIDPPKLLGHLKSGDLLDVGSFPKTTFTSTTVAARGGGKYDVTGNLELHGVKKSISFPADIALAGDVVTATAQFSINRKDFGVVYPGMPDDLIKDNVLIKLTIKAPAKG
jgi:polyisoprenoid-binding protein YceI